MQRQRVYCGNNLVAPQGYTRIGTPYQCLRKGYGVCLYNGRQGQRFQVPVDPQQRFFNNFYLFLSFVVVFCIIFVILKFIVNR